MLTCAEPLTYDRKGLHVDRAAQEAFDVLADPTRRAILGLLAEHDELAVGEIAEGIGNVGRTAVSSHLRILRVSGLIAERREGRFRYVSLRPEGPMRDAMTFLQGILGSGVPTAAAPLVQSKQDAVSSSDSEVDARTA